jgi:hypothetical protein
MRDLRMEPRIAPAIPSGFFRVTGCAVARGFEQCGGSGGVEFGVVARGKREAATRTVAGVLVDERSRHFYKVRAGMATAKMSDIRIQISEFRWVI